MVSSLRARLWFTYAILIAALLAVLVIALGWALMRAPRLLYPEIVYQLRLESETIPATLEKYLGSAPKQAERFLQRESVTRSLRFVLIGPNRKIDYDTGGVDLPYARLVRSGQLDETNANQVRTVRPKGGGLWLYMLRRLDSGAYLMVLAPAPNLPLRTLFRDQFISTFLYAGLAALGLSFLLALWLSGWISAPLRRMVGASQAVARGEFPEVMIEGPREVQELAQAMNEMSRRVRVSQQSQRDFVANVSHELKTPLTSIQGFSQAILDGAAQTPEALQQAAGVIYNEAARMHRLVLDLLSLARLEAGTADLQRAPVSLNLLLGSVIEKFAPQAREAAVELRTDFQDIPPLIGDGDRLAQVFTNLVDNAIKFTPAGGQVTVGLRMEDGSAVASVVDNGPGIANADQARIFERFYQVDKSRKGGSGHGTGLGLAIARQIVLAHGGKIWVESQPAQGSCFVVKIPLSRADDSNLTAKGKGKR